MTISNEGIGRDAKDRYEKLDPAGKAVVGLITVLLFEVWLSESAARIITRLLYLEASDPRWADLARMVDAEPPTPENDWQFRLEAFAGQLKGLLDDERTPADVREPLQNAVLEIGNRIGKPFEHKAIIREMIEHFAPEKSDG